MSEREKVTLETDVVESKLFPVCVADLNEPHRTWLLMRDEVEAYLKKLAHGTDGDSHGLVSSNISEEAVRLISKLGGV